MMKNATGIASLPNELLIQLLTSFPTRMLLPLALVSHRFHDIVVRILHNRLFHTTSLKDHKLVLECFHPSSKLSTPHLFCEYLGTDGVSNEAQGEGSLFDNVEDCGRLGKLFSIYSHFRPVMPDQDKKIRRPHPAGDIPGHSNTSTWFPGPSLETGLKEDVPGSSVNLESHELFSQLVAITNLVKVGPKRGLFLSIVNIGDGVIRIWRDWLADRAKASASSKHVSSSIFDAGSSMSALDEQESEEEHRARMLWVDNSKTVGLRLRIFEQKDMRNRPLLLRVDEDAPVSYTLQYEELVIKTAQVLLQLEESLLQESNHVGKAIVIGNWN